MSVVYNAAALARHEISLSIAESSARGASAAAYDATADSSSATHAANSTSPLPWLSTRTPAELLAALQEERKRVAGNADYEFQCDRAIGLARAAIAARARADAMRREADRMAAQVAPLRRLVTACKAWITETGATPA